MNQFQANVGGGREYFNEIYEEQARILFRNALKITGSKEDAEDIVQEVFAKLWMQWDRLREVENLKSYLFRMTQNESTNFFKKRSRQRRWMVEDCKEIDGIYYDHSIWEKECNNIYHAAIKRLSERQQRVILLRDWDFSRQEIAEKLNISKNTTDNHLSNALKKLRGYVCRKLQIRVEEEEHRPERRKHPALAA